MNVHNEMIADLANRRSFIGGSDARTIMGDDESALVHLWRLNLTRPDLGIQKKSSFWGRGIMPCKRPPPRCHTRLQHRASAPR